MEQANKKVKSTFKYVILLFISGFLLPLIFEAAIYNMKEIYNLLLFYMFSYVCIILFFAIFCKNEIIDVIKDSYMKIKDTIKIGNIVLLFLFGSVSTAIIQIVVYLLNMYLIHIRDGDSKGSYELVLANLIKHPNLHNLVILLTMISFTLVFAPVVEEIIFRGLILQSLRQKMNLKIAVILGALIFGLWHINLYTALCAFFMGIILSISYMRYKSIFVPIIIHMGANALGLLGMILSSVK